MKKDVHEHGHFGTGAVTCPYCNYEPDEMWPQPNGDWEIEECPSCEKNFYASASIDYSSKRDCELNGLKCEWQADESMNLFSDRKFNWFKCPKCLDTRIEDVK